MKQANDDELKGGTRRRIAVVFFVSLLSIALTAGAAMMSSASAQREKELLFDQAVMAEKLNFATSSDSWIEEFDSAVAFVGATFPAAPDEYASFFNESILSRTTTALDPGLSFVELVQREDVDALEARERAFGEADFRVMNTDTSDVPLFVVTRSTANPNFATLTIEGTNLRPLASDSLDMALASPERFLFQLDGEEQVAEVFGQREDGFGLPVAIIVEQVPDRATGETVGWVARSFDVPTILNETIEHSQNSLNVAVTFLGETVNIVDPNPADEQTFEDSELYDKVVVPAENVEFTLSLWADDDFGVASGLFDQRGVWSAGLLVTGILFFGMLVWVAQQRRLETTSFELDHARTLASTDTLTGLLNRKGFMELADRLDVSNGGTLFFLDLDGFKQVNDTQGHAEGDRVLRAVAEAIRAQFRGDDVVSRFGGDEFMIFTPSLYGPAKGIEVAERLVKAIDEINFDVTCSIGAAERPPFDLTPIETLIRKADRAMYRAKQAGGNQFEGPKQSEPSGS